MQPWILCWGSLDRTTGGVPDCHTWIPNSAQRSQISHCYNSIKVGRGLSLVRKARNIPGRDSDLYPGIPWHPQESTHDMGPAKNHRLGSKNGSFCRKTQEPHPQLWLFPLLNGLAENVPRYVWIKGLEDNALVYHPFYLRPSLWVSWSFKTQELPLWWIT